MLNYVQHMKKWCIFTGQEGRETLAVGKEGSKEGKEDSRADKADKASKADEVDKADVWIPETTGETMEDVAITDATITKRWDYQVNFTWLFRSTHATFVHST